MRSKKIKIPKVTEDDVLVVKVGTEEHPATENDIMNIQLLLSQCRTDKNLCLVTHHAIEFVILKKVYLKNVIFCKDIHGTKKQWLE